MDRDEKLRLGAADLMICSQAAAGDDTVHMDMIVQFLIPCVQYLNNPREGTEVFGIGRQLQQSLGRTSMEETVKKLLVAVQQIVQFMRDRKNDMEIGRIDDLGAPGIDPYFFFHGLAVGAVAIAAGIIVVFCVTAVRTKADRCAKLPRLAGENGHGSLLLNCRLNMCGCAEVIIG